MSRCVSMCPGRLWVCPASEFYIVMMWSCLEISSILSRYFRNILLFFRHVLFLSILSIFGMHFFYFENIS